MSKLFYNKIYELQEVNVLSKHEHLVNGIINSIDSRILKKGDQLPSINQMVAELGYARKTIVKAYEELKGRGIVESKNFKGYFIASEETNQVLKVALMLYAFHGFQETFYNALRQNLQGNVQLDIFFHHNNYDIFNKILSDIKSKYGMLVIAPAQDNRTFQDLNQIPSDKLLIIDRYLPLSSNYSYVVQEFENTTYQKLNALKKYLIKYKKVILLYDEEADHPEGIKLGFDKFVQETDIPYCIQKEYAPSSVESGSAYIVISDNWLWELIKDCRDKKLWLGEDVGIISHNNNIIKEMIFNGITTISTDFKEMAKKTAQFINTRQTCHTTIPSKLFERGSL